MKALMRPVMRRLIEIAAATFLVVCITASSAAFAARCAAIKRQCGGKFYASACGDRLMSAVN
jgi:hypothetical protein